MVSYQIDVAAGVVELRDVPIEDADQVRQLFERILADPSYRPGYGFFRNRASIPPLSTPSIRTVAEALAGVPALRGTRWAIVATDPANFGTMRMLEVFTGEHGMELKVFTEEKEARQWLAERPARRDHQDAR
jgi:hypothetical protein